MMDQEGITFWLTGIKRLLLLIENEIGPHRTADTLIDNPVNEGVDALSILCFLTPSCSVTAAQPILGAIDSTAVHC